MSDPLRDPRFPDRPQSRDFWRMADASNQVDGQAVEGELPFEEIVESLCDVEALTYMSSNRVAMVESKLGIQLPPDAAWIDGFIIGLLFQKKGGHQDG